MSTSSTTTISQCPYAVALSSDDGKKSQQQSSSPNDDKSYKSLLTAELRQCPAFAGGSSNGGTCPFKQAKSAEEIQQTFRQIPKSHYTEHKSSLYKVIQHLHQVHEEGADAGFREKLPSSLLQGGQCPMKPYIDSSTVKEKGSFARAMEECSLAAIMARLAADMEDSEHSGEAATPRNSEGMLLEETSVTEAERDMLATIMQNNNEAELESIKRNSLAEALKTGTAISHQAAEDVHFVRNFIRGQIDRHLYQEMILGLYHVYVALEEALDQKAPSFFPTCHFPDELSRRETLEEDCEFWHNTRTPSPRTISPATQDYIDRIHYLAQHEPLLLLAHSYTRYLGDLSGGKILARVARRALDLDKGTGDGLAFYRFEKVQSYKAFKDNYRQSLDALPLTSAQIQALVAEANVAFCLNMRLFQELDVMATIPGARVMSMDEVLELAHKGTSTNDAGANAEDQCPFLVNKKKEQLQQETKKGARCPWPFVFAHDPWQGMKDWQTWLLLGMLLAWWKMAGGVTAPTML
jgi:heme oxygenase (biliverdin-producing, ferredoxin)